jgi:uncharacterized protein (TIGR02594 family)
MITLPGIARPIGGMTNAAKGIFDHIEQLLHNATLHPGSAPVGQQVPVARPADAILIPPTVGVPHSVVTSADLPWMIAAKKELGVAEIPGPANNPRIIWYHSFCTLKATYDSVSWCSAFANAMMISSGFKGTRSAAALDWINMNYGIELKYAVYGCLSIWDWGNGHGHVGFILGTDDNRGYHVLGGNQKDSDGLDKVCVKWFPWSLAPSSFKWPKEYPLPSDAEVDNS